MPAPARQRARGGARAGCSGIYSTGTECESDSWSIMTGVNYDDHTIIEVIDICQSKHAESNPAPAAVSHTCSWPVAPLLTSVSRFA